MKEAFIPGRILDVSNSNSIPFPEAIVVHRPKVGTRKTHFLFLAWRVLLLVILSGSVRAEPLALQQERLGAWNYLYPMAVSSGGDVLQSRAVSTPTTLGFGATRERIAVILPGSTRIAEFKTGVFDDLQLPDEWLPLSLAANHDGNLFCLVQHSEKFLLEKNEWKKRWAISLGAQGWERPVLIPYPGCDRLEFDSQNRLWALGTDPQVGFLANGKWTTFTYSNDRKLQFLPLRLSEDAGGQVLLFALQEPPGGMHETSHLTGTLIYADNRFARQPGASTAALNAAESRRYAEPIGEPGFDRAHGYVCQVPALNVGYRGPKTALQIGKYFFVSLANDGFLWAEVAGLATAPPLDSDEWESLDDITVPPTPDAAGNLWVGRGKQLLKIGPAGTEVAKGLFSVTGERTIDFDPLGRPWVMPWHGSFEGTVTICDHAVLRTYPNFPIALQSEGSAFVPGRIFPFAVKTPAGLLAAGGGFFDSFTIVDPKGPRQFTARQISSAPEPAHPGHGYNPFRGGEPWIDAAGHIYTSIDGVPCVYNSAHRTWSLVKEDDASDSTLPPLPQERSDNIYGPFRAKLESASHFDILFKGFHFFAVTEAGERQLDTGLNPLACYPFWTGWHRSPGATTPCVDPTGRLWISALGPYARNRQWFVLRKPSW
jgi:hypothetical protein